MVDEQKLNKPKDVDEILNEQIETALKEHSRKGTNLFLSSISAGLELGFSFFLISIVYTLLGDNVTDFTRSVLHAFSYSIGFVLVIIGKSVLFTEYTTIAVVPVLNGNASVKNLLKIWGIIYFGNLTGGFLFSLIMSFLPVEMNTVSVASVEKIVLKIIGYNGFIIFLSGIIAGWLMGLLSWLVTSAQETISRIVCIVLVTGLIGLGNLHHSVLGSIEVLTGVLVSERIYFSNYIQVLLSSTLGNIVGGVIFVQY
ncbi:MAG: formate/nitrite transporter family protein [Bacteroidales bacterium]|nr:formate/nitrite transporter family protein [Bacteroidales bacterium]